MVWKKAKYVFFLNFSKIRFLALNKSLPGVRSWSLVSLMLLVSVVKYHHKWWRSTNFVIVLLVGLHCWNDNGRRFWCKKDPNMQWFLASNLTSKRGISSQRFLTLGGLVVSWTLFQFLELEVSQNPTKVWCHHITYF